MNADRHFAKGEAFEASQARLDAVSDSELVIEEGYTTSLLPALNGAV
jgi:hypothetical protein